MLRFHPIQIAEWMEALLPRRFMSKDTAVVTVADRLGISRTRPIQFLNLLRIPVDLRGRLKGMTEMTEARLRVIVQMDPGAMRVAVGRLLGPGMTAVAKAGRAQGCRTGIYVVQPFQ